MGLDIGLLGFKISQLPDPEIYNFCNLRCRESVQSHLKWWGASRPPYYFEWLWNRFRAAQTTKINDFRSRNRPILKPSNPMSRPT